jgi:hypothetical protein
VRPRSAFACWRRSLLTTAGMMPLIAGLKKALEAPATAASAASDQTPA